VSAFFTHEKISLGFKFYSSSDATDPTDCPRMKQHFRGTPCTKDFENCVRQECELVLQFAGQRARAAANARGRDA
jgi:hypothetical protein